MKHPLRAKDKKRFLQVAGVVVLLLLIAAGVSDVSGGEVVLAAMLLAVGLQMLALHRNAESRARRQDALVSIYATLRLEGPLPDLQDWTAAADLLKKLLELTLLNRPTVILEAGSGASTLICAAALKKLGRGRVITLEHEAEFAEQTCAWLAMHGLSDYARVVHAPLVPYDIGGESRRWYDLSKVELPETIDLLFVDGPPRRSSSLARFPAVPLLHARLSKGAHILLDDAARRDEREIVRRWCSQFGDLRAQYFPLAKGAVVLRIE